MTARRPPPEFATSHGTVALLAGLAVTLVGCSGGGGRPAVQLAGGFTPGSLQTQVAKFAPVTLGFDTARLDGGQRTVIKNLVQASEVLDTVFRLQVWRDNLDYAARLQGATGPGMDAARDYYAIMYGPWDRLESDAPFLAVGPKPEGAGFYPPDVTRQDFDAYLRQHPADSASFTSYYTVIRRTPSGGLEAVPYSQFYHDRLARASSLLRQASEAASNPSLKKFLRMRAESFTSDDYFDSEVAWVELSGNTIEPTIGPYEVYEDKLFGYKTSFESFIALRDSAASAQLAGLVSHLKYLEEHLPEPDAYKNLRRDFSSPISVVTLLYAAGEAGPGVQTLAFNLPNDPKVRREHGSKKVLLRNVTRAKFEHILKPIAHAVLDSAQASEVTFDPYFTRILMHELSHGLGPDYVHGRQGLTVNKALRDRYSAIEEAKADAVGTHNLAELVKQGVYDREFLHQVYISHLADLFRCVRFGANEAHGKGCMTQFNFLREQGAIRYDSAGGTFSVYFDRMPDAMSKLAGRYLTLEATGDYEGAGKFLDEYGSVPPDMRKAL
ncbi:MAG TPA: peptidase, partial [Gemmatimonadota bacterium]|nr:peptidase [Gemmatimonadota bacterium]